MDFGLLVCGAADDAQRTEVERLLKEQHIPLSGFVTPPHPRPLLRGDEEREPFLRLAALTLLTPGTPIPAASILRHLNRDARPGNVLRRYVSLHLSLLPYLRLHGEVKRLRGCQMVGDALIAVPLGRSNLMDAALPPGEWTDLMDNTVHTGRLRGVRSFNAMPILVRENTLLPVYAIDRATSAVDHARLILHWYQPAQETECRLPSGAIYRAWRDGNSFDWAASVFSQGQHVFVHESGMELVIRGPAQSIFYGGWKP